MDTALLSTISALAGTVVGGLTSFATSFASQYAQSRAERVAKERAKREELYGKFIEETARLYSHAQTEERINYDHMVDIFALRGRILLISSVAVTEAADAVIKEMIDIYLAPKRTDAELRADLDQAAHDPMLGFAHVCRAELRALR